jgi:Uri superfamily endonuclease
MSTNQAHRVIVLGETCQSGVYVLHMRVNTALAMAIGRFQNSTSLLFPAGDYLYIGSALGQKGAPALAPRLLRHARRSGQQAPHALYGLLRETLIAHELVMPRRATAKRSFWHVDYLLDAESVELRQTFALRTEQPLEPRLAQHLLRDSHTFLIRQGLGASDYPGHTHLFGVDAPASWWAALPAYLQTFLSSGW